MKFIDLFSGIGGFHIAFKNAGGNCVLACEIDKFARKSYQDNFGDDFLFPNDITTLHHIPQFEVLCAGFPCQAFSLAGKQLGFEDTRGTLFFDVARLAKKYNPPILLLENVKNLIHHDKGNTLKVIKETLTEIGYFSHVFIINADSFVPQKRERVYIVAFHSKFYTKEQFNSFVLTIENDYLLRQLNNQPNFWCILEDEVDSKYTLSDKLWGYLQRHSAKHREKGNGFGFGLMTKYDKKSRTLTARYYKDGAEILIDQEGKNPRKLTPREAARLMGFPDTFIISVSNTQAYKQFGNSVCVPVISMFAKRIKEYLQIINRHDT